jgi:hypothetical protein
VCGCVKERETERQRERQRERKGRIVMTPKTIVIVLPGDDTSERKIVFNDTKKLQLQYTLWK